MERNYLVVRKKPGSKPSRRQCTKQRISFQKSSADKGAAEDKYPCSLCLKRSDDAPSSYRASSFPQAHKRLLATSSVKCNFRDAHYSTVYVNSPNRQCVPSAVVVIVPNAVSSRLQRLLGHAFPHIGTAAVSIMAAGRALDGTLRPSEGMKCVGVTNVTSDEEVSGDVSW